MVFTRVLRVSLFGESHGPAVGVVLKGVPPGVPIDVDTINRALERRRPGGRLASPRKEPDRAEILSGVFRGRTTGGPLAIVVRNRDVDSSFYERIKYTPRPGHGDLVAWYRYGGYQDYRGGGHFSGRRTVGLVAAGAVAARIIELESGTRVYGYVKSIGGVEATVKPEDTEEFRRAIDEDPLKCPDPDASERMARLVEEARESGDSLGSVVESVAFNVPPGLGDPPHWGIDASLGGSLFSIPAAKAVEIGLGLGFAGAKGSEVVDEIRGGSGSPRIVGNRAGGINAGITNGMPIIVRVAFKPPSSIRKRVRTVDLRTLDDVELAGGGRHDPVIGPRAAPVVESVMALVIADHMLYAKSQRLGGVEWRMPWESG